MIRRAITWQLVVGAAIILGWLAVGMPAPLLTAVDPLKAHSLLIVGTRAIPPPFEPGTYGFPLGSDGAGRDLWVEVMYGARVTLVIVFITVGARLVVGAVLGTLAGWSAGRPVDRAISMIIDAFAAFPTILFAMLWIFAFDIRSGVSAFAIALAITGWWGYGRATRSAVVSLRDRPFIEAARALGLSDLQLLVRHVAPNVLPILAVSSALEASAVLLALGELGFLGIVVGGGFSVPLDDRGIGSAFIFSTTEWGAILAGGRFAVFNAPWIALVPAAAFASAILGFNLLGYGLRTVFERVPVALSRVLSWRSAAAVVALVIAVRLVTPYLGPAAGYVSVARSFDSARATQHIGYLADPAREGRYSGSAGYAAAAEYAAERFRGIGLEPGGDQGTYFQRFQHDIVRLSAMPTLATVGASGRSFAPRIDFTPRIGGRAGGGTAEGNIVYVGGGIQTPEYSDYAGTDPRGNIVLIAGPTQGDTISTAIRQGASAVIFVTPADSPLIKFSVVSFFEKDTLPVLTVSEAVADELIAPSGKRIAELRSTLEERRRRAEQRPSLRRVAPEPLSFDTPTRVRLSVPLGPVERVETMNVVGILRGADAERAKRYLVVGGHLDGVGTDPDGTVFPAANDNASGPAVVIEVARVLAAHRTILRNSFVFVAFAAEEEGLVGSDIFVQRSSGTPYRIDNVVAFLNLDMVGCCGPLAASDETFALRERVKSAAERLGHQLTHMPGGGGSDHLSYLRRRVPAIMLGPSDLGPFHTPGDTPATLDPARLRSAGEVTIQALLEMGAAE